MHLPKQTLFALVVFCIPSLSLADEFTDLNKQITQQGPNYGGYTRLEKESLRKDALILATDLTPADVVLRRTLALINHLTEGKNPPDLTSERTELRQIFEKNTPTLDQKAQRSIFDKACQLRRRIAFKNPLLDFDSILFLKHHKQGRGEIHMVDQYLGFNQKIGGGVFILKNPFSDHAEAVNLLADSKVASGRFENQPLPQGSFISLDLDYDAQTISFAYTQADHIKAGPEMDWEGQHWTYEESRKKNKNYWQYHFRPNSTFHIYTAKVDGSKLSQITDTSHNEYDPCFLPNGRLIYLSERTGGSQRCGIRSLPTATLHSMEKDGSDPITLSWHDTNEWHPSVDNNGMIVYTRWDYIDRDSDIAHHLWSCYPDGRDPRSSHGNYPKSRESRPWMELSIRAIPESDKFIAVAAPHHGQAYGSLILIDQKIPDDRAMSQIKRITPEAHFPESEKSPGVALKKGRHSPKGETYGSPWPLSEDFYLCVYDSGQKNYGIYLVDSFGNRELLYQDKEIPCLDPIPLKTRPRPPVLPSQTHQSKRDQQPGAKTPPATIAVMNVYEAELPLPKDTKITELRVVGIFPKWNAFMDKPRIGLADQSIARGVLGTVPVEADGSVYLECPTDIEIYFQLLDEKGQAVQTMRSGTYLHPGERMSCIGCHENKQKAPSHRGSHPMAMRRAPSKLKPEATGSYPITFPRLVQPVLDKHCVDCHAKEDKAFPLDGGTVMMSSKKGKPTQKTVPHGWSNAFYNLRTYGWGKHGGNGAIKKNKGSYSIPGKIGAKASRLLPLLENEHYGVELSEEELRRITLWIDCNTNYYGAYRDTEKQTRGEIVMPKVHSVKPMQPAR